MHLFKLDDFSNCWFRSFLLIALWLLFLDADTIAQQSVAESDYSEESKSQIKKVIIDEAFRRKFSNDLAEREMTNDTGVIELDIGGLRAGEFNGFRLPVSVKGDRSFMVTDLKSSCGCTIGVPERRRFEPGETVNIFFSITPKKLGAFRSRATIVFDERKPFVMNLHGRSLQRCSLVASEFAVDDNTESVAIDFSFNFGSSSVPDDVGKISVECGTAETKTLSRLDSSGMTVLLSSFKKGYFSSKRERDVHVQLSWQDGHSEFHLVKFVNKNAVQIKPSRVIATTRGGSISAKVFVSIDQSLLDSESLSVTSVELPDLEISLEILKKYKALSLVAISFPVSSTKAHEALTLDWVLGGDHVVARSYVSLP